jgi:hypothetical protein
MSRPVTVTLSHDLGKEEARRRLTDGFDALKSSIAGGMMLKFNEQWTNPDQMTFSAKGLGMTADGKIDVFPQHVRIEVVLPGPLAAIAEQITKRLQKDGALLLEKK